MNDDKMIPVETNRSYVKGRGQCVNVNNTAYQSRLKRLQSEREKDNQISSLQNEVEELKKLVHQLIAK